MKLIKVSPIRYINPNYISSVTEALVSPTGDKTMSIIKMNNGDIINSSIYINELLMLIDKFTST